MMMVNETTTNGVRFIEMAHPTGANPFGVELEDQVKAALRAAQEDSTVRAVVVGPAKGMSFSAGGDFNEVKSFTGGSEVDRWIDRVTDLYAHVLKLEKPTVAAVDGHAIGMGFQFALMFDQRVVSESAEFRMPELIHGIGCSVGAAILSNLVSRGPARQIIYRGEAIGAQRALEYGVADEVVPSSELHARAHAIAERMGSYPEVAFRHTKRTLVVPLMTALLSTAEESKAVHRAAFAARGMEGHFRKVLGDVKFFDDGAARPNP